MKVLTATNRSLIAIGILLVRCMVGLIFFTAGAGKVFGWFGGMGLQATLDAFKAGMNIPAFWAYVSTYTELIGGLLLIIGLLTRPAALALAINMLVAIVLMGTKNFFMGGAAYPCSLMVSSLLILLTGPMAFSVDAFIGRHRNEQPVNAR